MNDIMTGDPQQVLLNNIIRKISDKGKPSIVSNAILPLVNRLMHGFNSITLLLNKPPSAHHVDYDCISILRALYDAMLQSLYILHNPQERENRAKLFLDYEVIEQCRLIDMYDNSNTAFARRMSQSSKRKGSEKEIREKYEKVKDKYLMNSGKVRLDWYPHHIEGNQKLAGLAHEVGLTEEYNLMQKFLSGVLHSSPFYIIRNIDYPHDWIIQNAWGFVMRVLGKIAESEGIELSQDEKDCIKISNQNVFNHGKEQ